MSESELASQKQKKATFGVVFSDYIYGYGWIFCHLSIVPFNA